MEKRRRLTLCFWCSKFYHELKQFIKNDAEVGATVAFIHSLSGVQRALALLRIFPRGMQYAAARGVSLSVYELRTVVGPGTRTGNPETLALFVLCNSYESVAGLM